MSVFASCTGCGRPVDVQGIFPGGRVRCACGEVLEVAASAMTASAPYRDSAAPVTPAATTSETTSAPHPRGQRSSADKLAGRALCPRCGATFGAGGDAPLQGCDACGGVFVRHDALEDALASRRGVTPPEIERSHTAATAATEVRYLRCPRCGETMSRSLFARKSGVVVDVCRVHGTWFDATELERAAVWRDAVPPKERAPIERAPVDPELVRRRAELGVALSREAWSEERRFARNTRHTNDVLDLILALVTSDD